VVGRTRRAARQSRPFSDLNARRSSPEALYHDADHPSASIGSKAAMLSAEATRVRCLHRKGMGRISSMRPIPLIIRAAAN
jgi:hypothetical protein